MLHPLQQLVRNTSSQHNRRLQLELVCWLLAGLLGLLLIAGGADYGLRLVDRGLRVLLTLSLLIAAGGLLRRLIHAWHQQRWTESTAAQKIQRAFPQLGDRLASACEFLRQEESDPTAGSALLRRAVVARTTSDADQLCLRQVSYRPTLRWAWVAALSLSLIAGGVAGVQPTSISIAMARLFAPWNHITWPRQHDLALVDAPTVVARGQPLEVRVVDNNGNLPQDVTVQFRHQHKGRSPIEALPVVRMGDQVIARRDEVTQSFSLRAVGGDHVTMPWHEVEVREPPRLETLTFTLHPPAYSGLLPTTGDLPLRLLSGTQVHLVGKATEPLSQAWLETDTAEPLPCLLSPQSDQHTLQLPEAGWTVTADEDELTVRFRFRLQTTCGLTSTTPWQTLRVVADAVPTIAWQEPAEDLFVLPSAIVPIVANATDDLALQSVELVVTPAGKSTKGEPRLTFFDGPATPPTRQALPPTGQPLDHQQLEQELELPSLTLATESRETKTLRSGQTIELWLEARDYRGGIGRSPVARRVTILSEQELESRWAAAQANLLRALQLALAAQRSTHQETNRLAADIANPASLQRSAVDAFFSNHRQQRKVRQLLTAPGNGVIALAQGLLRQLTMNRMLQKELAAQLQQIVSVVTDLAERPLPLAEEGLTTLRKQLESQLVDNGVRSKVASAEPFSEITTAQQECIAALEKLMEQATQWSDADRFVRELQQLLTEQQQLRTATIETARRQLQARLQQQAGIRKAPLDQLAQQQANLAQRVNKLMQAMQEMIDAEQGPLKLRERLTDALAEAEQRDLSRSLNSVAEQIRQQQLGRAAAAQEQSTETLQNLVDLLRERSPTDPGKLAAQLRQLQQQLAALEQQTAQAAGEHDAGRRQERQRQLTASISRTARQLRRMTAEKASRSTQQAAQQAAPQVQQSPAQAVQQLQQAQQQLQQAQQQTAQRIAQLEQQQEMQLLERLAVQLGGFIPRQQQILERTMQLQHLRESLQQQAAEQQPATQTLSQDQSQLAEELNKTVAELAQRAVFQVALRGAVDDMQQVTAALMQNQIGRTTQELALDALSRMRSVRDVLRDQPPPPDQPPAGGNGGGAGQGAGQEPPLIDLAEIKMLRWLQMELNARTRQYEQELGELPATNITRRQEATHLATEQKRLEELVREMRERHNESNKKAATNKMNEKNE